MVSFSAQLHNLFRYKLLIRTLLGPRRAERLINRATFVISSGTNDMLSVYLASNRSNAISMEMYENHLITRVANYTQVRISLFEQASGIYVLHFSVIICSAYLPYISGYDNAWRKEICFCWTAPNGLLANCPNFGRHRIGQM